MSLIGETFEVPVGSGVDDQERAGMIDLQDLDRDCSLGKLRDSDVTSLGLIGMF